MPERGLGNEVQARATADQVADAAVAKFAQMYGAPAEPVKTEIPGPLKWAAGIVAVLLTSGVAALVFWLVSSVGEMQVTLARMGERMQQDVTGKEIVALKATDEKHDARLSNLEQRKTQ